MSNLFTQLLAESEKQRQVVSGQPVTAQPTEVSKERQPAPPFSPTSNSPQSTQKHENTDVQKHEAAKAQRHKNTVAVSHEPTKAQTQERANVHDYRTITRKTLDLFLDQVEMIDNWRARKRREMGGKSVTQGEVVREIFDFFKEAHNL